MALTKIRLRTDPDVAAPGTGRVVKEREVFEAVEVVPPKKKGDPGYLRAGERGWVFDRGIAGEWIGRDIVELIPPQESDKFKPVFRDPEIYKLYREFVDSPDFEKKSQELLKDGLTGICTENELAQAVAYGSKDMLDSIDAKMRKKYKVLLNQKSPLSFKWKKLAAMVEPQEYAEDGQPTHQDFAEPAGGERALRLQDSAAGWRVGIRVPTVCTAL